MDETACKLCREVVDTKFDKLRIEIKSNRELFDERGRFGDRALELAREGLDRRMEAENGIRNELREKTAAFITRDEYNANLKNVTDKAELLAKETSKLDGRMVAICFIVPIIVTILMLSIFQMVK